MKGQGQQQLVEVLAGEGEGVVDPGLDRRRGHGRGAGGGGRRGRVGGGRRRGGRGEGGRQQQQVRVALGEGPAADGGLEARGAQAGVGALELAGEAVLEAATRAVQAEAERAEGAAERAARLPLLGLRLEGRTEELRGTLLLGAVDATAAAAAAPATDGRLRRRAVSLLVDVQEVAAHAEGTHAVGAVGAAGDVLAPVAAGGPLLGGAVDEQAAGAVVAVARVVEAAAQLGLVLGVTVGYVELLEAVRELAALGVLAEARGGVAGAELRLVAGGAHPGGEGGGRGLDQREQGLGQGGAAVVGGFVGEQVVHHRFVEGGQEEVIAAGLFGRRAKL